MSSQFSYELDERQIRILMQDAELNYNEALWDKFDELATTQSKTSNNFSNYIPTINFGISRSIIVPILFIVLIGGLSAMLFSFVDFKKKESIEKEIPYVATIIDTKKPVTNTKPVIKPKQTASVAVKTNSIVAQSSITVTHSTVIALAPIIKKEEPIKVTITKPKEEIVSNIESKKETILVPAKKKKKRKMKPEELPTINTSTSLNDGANEPDLELK